MMKKEISKTRKELIVREGYFRQKAGLSGRELSQRLGFSVAYIAKFENGDFSIPAEVLLDIINICGTTPEEFFAKNYQSFEKDELLKSKITSLSDENKKRILDLIDNLK